MGIEWQGNEEVVGRRLWRSRPAVVCRKLSSRRLIGVGVGVHAAAGDLSSATVDCNSFAKFVFGNTITSGSEIEDLDVG